MLLRYKNGFDAGKYISFEEKKKIRKGNYYDALQKSSQGWHKNNQDYTAFIMEFITTLYFCYKEPDKRFAVIGSRKCQKLCPLNNITVKRRTPLEQCGIEKYT